MKNLLVNRYQIQELIGKGTFGSVYGAIDLKSKKQVAIKVENVSISPSSIEKEIIVLKKLEGQEGFPKLYSYGIYNDHNYIVLEKLGKNISQIFKDFSYCLSISEVAYLGCQMIRRIATLHAHEIIHRDVKPSQFLIKGKTLYMVDFGSCKSFIYAGSFHIPMTEDVGFIGTLMFASRNAHAKIQLSRRDDLESMCYSLAYLLRGNLPWMDSDSSNNTESKISLRKAMLSDPSIFEGFPTEFSQILAYVKGLNFYYCPDYGFIYNSFKQIIDKFGKSSIRILKKPKKNYRTKSLNPHKHSENQKNHKKYTKPNIDTTKIIDTCICPTVESDTLPEFKNRKTIENNCKIYKSETLHDKGKKYTITEEN
ncbi:hypothetical protein SteCoe_6875 [Stentor coeruleus]|uniref:Casein kinase I n=1 Tax=Stentor coeruleus TaxID=5963 RepID=A0A1R2CNX2_9CILI|nr:hypothetical protein SteCoe_6875 [Stentor coeruleus]